jgi:nucleotide-binding universal stress UspA family protein
MVHLELGQSNANLLQVAGDLAQRFSASVIGIAACQPMQMVYGDGYLSGDVIEQDLAEITREMQAVEAEFRRTLQGRAESLHWRSTVDYIPLAEYLAREVRAADLLITGLASGDSFDASRSLNTGDLVMQMGRPMLIVPTGVPATRLQRVLVGWKDTREARRAAIDALPLLRRAMQVTVVEIVPEAELADSRTRLADVVVWLARHGVVAETLATASKGDDAAGLAILADRLGADLVVAGAYGHSRLREWAFGGVTHDLLRHAPRCSFVSH